ncbi:hypothetical protein K443DRAFT_8139 [Laccaria amethystina LaAM-08-1]|uniref:Exoribonuclease Xrn1 D2/D3 domain-containing protein n=1 Tax=Laccaria amethystina LaAM-08-1 TaxID=1095629 RepID=A0A0C9X443_9AGAR|nr:hypothetical protein K443DRAFT_8139 [Laccaria amethystina LaAM-08-1]
MASSILPGPNPDGRVRSVKAWLMSKGVRDFEPVSLFCDQLGKRLLNPYLPGFSGVRYFSPEPVNNDEL